MTSAGHFPKRYSRRADFGFWLLFLMLFAFGFPDAVVLGDKCVCARHSASRHHGRVFARRAACSRAAPWRRGRMLAHVRRWTHGVKNGITLAHGWFWSCLPTGRPTGSPRHRMKLHPGHWTNSYAESEHEEPERVEQREAVPPSRTYHLLLMRSTGIRRARPTQGFVL